MIQMVKVSDAPGFVRDKRTGAVLNADAGALGAYKRRRDVGNSVLEDINTLKTELMEIKDLLRQVVGKK